MIRQRCYEEDEGQPLPQRLPVACGHVRHFHSRDAGELNPWRLALQWAMVELRKPVIYWTGD
jgi:hypothetical protein